MIRMNHQYPDAGPRRKCFETFRALPATARFTKTVLCRLSYGGVVSRTRSESRLYGRHAQFTTRAARGQDIPVGYAAEPAQGYIDRSPFDVPRSGRRKLFLPVYETADKTHHGLTDIGRVFVHLEQLMSSAPTAEKEWRDRGPLPAHSPAHPAAHSEKCGEEPHTL